MAPADLFVFGKVRRKDGSTLKVFVEKPDTATEPLTRAQLVQLIHGAVLIVGGQQRDFSVQMDWLARAQAALKVEK